jgi:hypothetical protein
VAAWRRPAHAPLTNILHIDGNDSTVTIRHLDGHGVGVEENSNILCSNRKIDPGGPVRRQERTFRPGPATSQKERTISMFVRK